MRKILLLVLVLLIAGVWVNNTYAREGLEMKGNGLMSPGAASFMKPGEAIQNANKPAPMIQQATVAEGGIFQPGDKVELNSDTPVYSRNANPATVQFGGSYTCLGSIPKGTELTIVSVTENITISNFSYPDGTSGANLRVLVGFCTQYEVTWTDANGVKQTGYIFDYPQSGAAGAVADVIEFFTGPLLSAAD
ncbi:MAG: hypothetical protein JW788_07380 [Candidatus Omnitrophica bacterium]|nr:hypothetical protein [Candidatus Omnitrophota bacterium]